MERDLNGFLVFFVVSFLFGRWTIDLGLLLDSVVYLVRYGFAALE